MVKGLIKRSQVNILEDAGTKVVAQALLENWQALANEMLLAFDEINRIKT